MPGAVGNGPCPATGASFHGDIMKLNFALLFLTLVGAVNAAELRTEYATGREYYASGEFKKAAAHFELAVKADPQNAEKHFWLGKSYQVLADIGSPLFGGRSASKARNHLSKALELAPENKEYRQQLFDFLVGSDRSVAALHRAETILHTVAETDPDYPSMQSGLRKEQLQRSSADVRLGGLVFTAPRQIVR